MVALFGAAHAAVSTPQQKPAIGPEEDQASLRLGIDRPGGDGQGFVAMFDPQPFENPLRRVSLLGRRRLVSFQDRVDDRNERSELRPLWSLGPHIAGRRRIAAHFGNRVPAQSENPRRLAPALPFDKDKPSNRCVNLHREHPRPSLFESDFEKVPPRKWPGFTPPRAIMPPLRGLLLLRRVHLRRRPRTSMGLRPRDTLYPN